MPQQLCTGSVTNNISQKTGEKRGLSILKVVQLTASYCELRGCRGTEDAFGITSDVRRDPTRSGSSASSSSSIKPCVSHLRVGGRHPVLYRWVDVCRSWGSSAVTGGQLHRGRQEHALDASQVAPGRPSLSLLLWLILDAKL